MLKVLVGARVSRCADPMLVRRPDKGLKVLCEPMRRTSPIRDENAGDDGSTI